jgi:multiple sugar transport system permease protein
MEATPAIINSLIVASGSTLLAVCIGYCAAYALSRIGTGGNFMYFFILLTRMLPPIAIAIPTVVFYSTIRMMDTHLGLILMYTVQTGAFAIWMIKSFIDEVPYEIEEAAIIDGCTNLEVVFKFTLPLVRGGVAATAFLIFILNWSEFLFALSVTHTEAITIPVQLIKYHNAVKGVMFGPIAAFSVISLIPTLIIGYVIQRYLVRGLTFGAVRGK